MSEQRAQWIQPRDKPWVTSVSCAALIWGRRSLVAKWIAAFRANNGFLRELVWEAVLPHRRAAKPSTTHAQHNLGGNSAVASEETYTDLYSVGRVGTVGRRRGKQAGARGSITRAQEAGCSGTAVHPSGHSWFLVFMARNTVPWWHQIRFTIDLFIHMVDNILHLIVWLLSVTARCTT